MISQDGRWLGRGFYNPSSQITIRIVSWDHSEEVGPELWRSRAEAAVERRRAAGMLSGCSACRLVHSEADGFPGLVADWYAGFLSVQFLSLAVERRREEILRALVGASSAEGVWERSEGESRRLEGLHAASGLLFGREPPGRIEIEEGGARFLVDVRSGHKTGFYLDQALNRGRTAAWMRGRRVLDCYGYTGGFTVRSLLSGAAFVETVDSSGPSLEMAAGNLELNGLSGAVLTCSDVPTRLRAARSSGERFDAVILDPPRFVSRHDHLIRAGRAYKDINMVALSVLRPGGILATFSCSGLVGVELFQKIVFEASVDAGRDVIVLDRLGQPPDHPVLLSLPQGGYLKGLVCMAL